MLKLFCKTSRWHELSETGICGGRLQHAKGSRKRKFDQQHNRPSEQRASSSVSASSHAVSKGHGLGDLRRKVLLRVPSAMPRSGSGKPCLSGKAYVAIVHAKKSCRPSAAALGMPKIHKSQKSVARNPCSSKGIIRKGHYCQQHKLVNQRQKTSCTALIRLDKIHTSVHSPLQCQIPRCAQCTFSLHRRSWSEGVASHSLGMPSAAGTRPGLLSWLNERPSHFGAEWGLGCSICATFLGRVMSGDLKHAAARNKRRSYSTKWSRYEVRGYSSMQACALRKHSLSTLHQLALKCFLCPASLWIPAQACKSDQLLLKGAVPQPEDWLRSWKNVSLSLSMRAASSLNYTEQFISSNRLAIKEVERRAFQQMVFIMQETVRRKKRDALQTAASITLLVDDKSPYREVRFKCCSVSGQVFKGVLCVLHTSISTDTPEQIDEDKCAKVAETVVAGIRALCTPLGGQVDQTLMAHVLEACKCFCADGAPSIQKAGRILRANHMPNLVILVRDFAHLLRSSAKDPLNAESSFQEFWELLFGKGGLTHPSYLGFCFDIKQMVIKQILTQ